MRSSRMNNPAKDIDSYLAGVPEEARRTLEELRKAIRSAAPKATECISYAMPAYRYHGVLVYFAAFKDHCSFFPGAGVLKSYQDELRAYSTSKGTIRFPIDKPLPAALVKKMVKARVKENEARAESKSR
ncbi:MAG TPA: DUF1801 domain-containing protein [Terriglobales bacterium]|nr:DUF1801 domain-containing protein [Terriglobales bacterium]